MRPRRIGVISGDSSLLVHLATRGGGIQVSQVDDLDDLRDFDAALVDLATDQDPAATVAAIPHGPTVVLLCSEDPHVPGVIAIQRPCSFEQVVDALITSTAPAPPKVPEDDLVIAIEEPVAVAQAIPTPAGPPQAPAAPSQPVYPDVPAQAPTVPALTPPSTEVMAHELTDAVELATSTADLADRVAALIARALDADHVALWHLDGDDLAVLGSAGLTDGARKSRISVRHPVVSIARFEDGILYRDADYQGPRAPGLPGSVSPAYAMLVLDEVDALADVVTLSGDHLARAVLEDVRGLVVVAGATRRHGRHSRG